jgi:hypothetical protein
MIASVPSISGIPVLGRPSSWCALKFFACFDDSHSSAHNLGQAVNFTDTTFAKWKLTVSTLRKVKSLKDTLSNTCFLQITKSNQGLV